MQTMYYRIDDSVTLQTVYYSVDVTYVTYKDLIMEFIGFIVILF